MLDDFKLETFLPLLQSTFRVRATNGEVPLELVSATGHGPADNPFVLVFRGRADCFLPQGMYVFEHAALGVFELFVSPTSHAGDVFTTEAVFNRAPVAGGAAKPASW